MSVVVEPRSARQLGRREPRPVFWFVLVCALGLLLAGTATVSVIEHEMTKQAEHDAIARARVATNAIFDQKLRTTDLTGPLSRARRRALTRLISRVELGPHAAGVGLYNDTGKRVFSTVAASAGSPSALQVRQALGGEVVSYVGSGRVLRTLLPLALTSGGGRGVIEIDENFAPTAAAARRSSLLIAASLEVLLLLFCVLMAPVARRTKASFRRRVQDLDEVSRHDQATGLLNRLGFQQAIEAITPTERAGAALLVVDLARFHEVNDALGSEDGDRLLAQVGKRLGAGFGDRSPVARLGQDEFGFLVSAGPGQVAAAASRLTEILTPPFEIAGVPVAVDAHAGGALLGESEGFDAALRQAGLALSAAKQSNRFFEIYDPARHDSDPTLLAQAAELREALRAGQLRVYYQQQVDLATRSIRGVEALVRWQHPTRGLLPPSEFIGEAEWSGRFSEIGWFVLETGVRQWARWNHGGVVLDLAVNVATTDLADPGFSDRIAALLEDHRMPAEYLVLEITERTLFQDDPQARAALDELNRIGVRLAVDDYGTGYSSLALLRQLPIRQVKIDRSFVTGIPADADNDEIVRSTVQLAHRLGANVVAEGVETDEEFDRLAAHGCDIAQGYLFGRAMPAEELTSILFGARGISDPPARRSPTPSTNGQIPTTVRVRA